MTMTTKNELVSASEAQGLLNRFARGREKGAASDVWGLYDRAEALAGTVIAREAEVAELRTLLGRFALATATPCETVAEPVEGADLYAHTSTGLVYARLHLAATDPTGKAAVVLAPVEGGPVVVYPADALHDAQGCFRALDARGAQGSILSAHLRVLQPLVKTVEPILAPTLRRLVDPLITSVRSLGQALAAHAAEPGE